MFKCVLTHRLHVVDHPGQGVRVDAADLVLADVQLPDGLVLQDGPEHGLGLLLVRVVSGQQLDPLD